MIRIAAVMCAVIAGTLAVAQTQDNTPTEFDSCGVLVQGAECVLFEGGGGKYYVPDMGSFHVGDAVRAVGTLVPNCRTICTDADGCISGGVLYDPAILPCGTALPNFPQDIITGAANACTAVSTALFTLTLGGLWYTRSRKRTS